MLGALVATAVSAHVPTYVGGTENCFTPPRVHTTSQVIYLRGSGGLEVHVESDTKPFDIVNNEVIDWDAVFKEEYDTSTYSLYVGCGGCVASEDPIVVDPFPTGAYEPREVEPFTQTAYSSIVPKAHRKFNSSLLSEAANCTQKHFTVRLVDYNNRTGSQAGKPIVWGAVIGLGETFTFMELLEFPLYVVRNHGETWNDAVWTVPLSFLVFAPLLMYITRYLLKAAGIQVLEIDVDAGIQDGKLFLRTNSYAREWLYELALVGFAGAMVEEFIHLVFIAQPGAPVGYGLWVGLFAVIGLANGLPIFQITTAWAAMKWDPADKTTCPGCYWSCSASPMWAPLEILFGFSYLLLFGAGFYLGPAAIVLAGVVRLGELKSKEMGVQRRVRSYAPVDPKPMHQPDYPRMFFGA